MFNLMETKVIRDLNPSDINKLISVGGMVTRASTIIPDLQCARDIPPADAADLNCKFLQHIPQTCLGRQVSILNDAIVWHDSGSQTVCPMSL
jgi:hypothetical protein